MDLTGLGLVVQILVVNGEFMVQKEFLILRMFPERGMEVFLGLITMEIFGFLVVKVGGI